MLHVAEMICSNDTIFLKEVNQRRSLFLVTNYISRFFDEVFRKYMIKNHSLSDQSLHDNEKDTDFEKCFVKIQYVGIDSKC